MFSRYFVEEEEDGSEAEDETVVDEGFTGESADGPGPPDFDHDQSEPEGLDGSGEGEEHGELTAAEEHVHQEDHYCQDAPVDHVCFLYDLHRFALMIINIVRGINF